MDYEWYIIKNSIKEDNNTYLFRLIKIDERKIRLIITNLVSYFSKIVKKTELSHFVENIEEKKEEEKMKLSFEIFESISKKNEKLEFFLYPKNSKILINFDFEKNKEKFFFEIKLKKMNKFESLNLVKEFLAPKIEESFEKKKKMIIKKKLKFLKIKKFRKKIKKIVKNYLKGKRE